LERYYQSNVSLTESDALGTCNVGWALVVYGNRYGLRHGSMSYCFDFNSRYGVLRCRLEGDISDDVLKQCYKLAGEYAALTSPNVGIVDFSSVAAFNVSAQTVRDLAHSTPAIAGHLPRFIVVPDHIYGLARMFQQCGDETRPHLHVVHSLAEAHAFLGIEEADFQPLKKSVALAETHLAANPERKSPA